jgi:hypothetical protein
MQFAGAGPIWDRRQSQGLPARGRRPVLPCTSAGTRDAGRRPYPKTPAPAAGRRAARRENRRSVRTEGAAWPDEAEAALVEISGQRLEHSRGVDQVEIAVGLQELRRCDRLGEMVTEQAAVAARAKPGAPLRCQPRIFGRPSDTGAVAASIAPLIRMLGTDATVGRPRSCATMPPQGAKLSNITWVGRHWRTIEMIVEHGAAEIPAGFRGWWKPGRTVPARARACAPARYRGKTARRFARSPGERCVPK